ncbi:hypothetical protein RI367_005744 [Sorochytrium milnesiophthora]
MKAFLLIALLGTLVLATTAAPSSLSPRDYPAEAPAEQSSAFQCHLRCQATGNYIGSVFFHAVPHQYTSARVYVEFANASTTYAFHIHESPVSSATGKQHHHHHLPNCTATGQHYDPTHRNPTHAKPYNVTKGDPSTYEAGDLSGKWGALTTLPAAGLAWKHIPRDPTLTDPQQDLAAGRSVVLHTPDGARVACCTIQPLELPGGMAGWLAR